MSANLNLGILNAIQGFNITGAPSGSESGFSVSNAGDVNNDGYDDIIIGAPYANINSGISYVIYGNSTKYLSNLDLADLGTKGFSITGASAGDFSGWSVSGAGDFNGDSYDDIIIGAPQCTLGSTTCSDTGISYVIFGSKKTTAISLASLALTQGFSIHGASNKDNSGQSVSGAGDVNKDGYDDVIIGSPGATDYAGESYIIYGAKDNNSPIILSSLGAKGVYIAGISAGDKSGFSVSGAGDINNDGYADLIIGAYGAQLYKGASYIIYGSAALPSTISLSALGSYGISVSGINVNDESGYSVSGAGDVNNDGYDDIIIGAFLAGSGAGASYLIYGSASLPSTISLASLGSSGSTISGPTNSHSGYSVGRAGNVNEDGYDDIIIGAPDASNDLGISYVIYGSNSFSSTIDLTNLGTQGFSVDGANTGGLSGASVNCAGDINNDGYKDIIIGAFGTNSNAGASYVIYGAASGFKTSNPTPSPTFLPSSKPTQPTGQPTSHPTSCPSGQPSTLPTLQPSSQPSRQPSIQPTGQPSGEPSAQPSVQPSMQPSVQPTGQPSGEPSAQPSRQPSVQPTIQPSGDPSAQPSNQPSVMPSSRPTNMPSSAPSSDPTAQPNSSPSSSPSSSPTSSPTQPRVEIVNNNIESNPTLQAITTISSILAALVGYQIPFWVLNNWGHKYKLLFDDDLKVVGPGEIGIYLDKEKLFAIFKDKKIEVIIDDGNNNGISAGLYSLIRKKLEQKPTEFSFLISEENQLRKLLLSDELVKSSWWDLLHINGYFKPKYIIPSKFCFIKSYTELGVFKGFIYYYCRLLFGNLHFLTYQNKVRLIDFTEQTEFKQSTDSEIGNPLNEAHQNTAISHISIDEVGEDKKPHLKKSCVVCSIDSMIDPLHVRLQDEEFARFGRHLTYAYQDLRKLPTAAASSPQNLLKDITIKTDNSNPIPDQSFPSTDLSGSLPRIQNALELYPLVKYINSNVVYPLVDAYVPGITLPEISNAMLVTAHMSIGHLYAWQQPHSNVPFYIVESVAKSGSFAARLGVTKFINDYRNELEQNEQTITSTESLKHCVSTVLTYTVPDLLICAAARAAMPGYECSDLNLGAKLSFAGSECYWSYKASQEPVEPTTVDIVIPYAADVAAGIAAYANGYGLMGVVTSVVAADWMSRLVMDAVPDCIGE